MPVRIALPKGRLLAQTASLLEKAGWRLGDYDSSLRNYRLKSALFPDLQIKVFQEKDIPVQVAIGNYDLGICGLDWIEELSAKYAAASIIRIKDLDYGHGTLWMAGAQADGPDCLETLRKQDDPVRIASEYPNIAEAFALQQRLRRFSVYPVWGASEAYPPESATLSLVTGNGDAAPVSNGLTPITRVLNYSAFLIANRRSWEQADLSAVLHTLEGILPEPEPATNPVAVPHKATATFPTGKAAAEVVRIALPDGHQQKPAVAVLQAAGIEINDYPSATGNRRPTVRLDGVVAKVIRPQDMPMQVANGNFDLALTGRDWLADHLAQFPASGVRLLADLGFARVRIVAVVHQNVPADSIYALRQYCSGKNAPLRVASEYVNLADRYARENHLGMYRIIPTWGATEAFLPEDADLLIENTETGSTIVRHNLKIIDTLFESTGCLIGAGGKASRLKQSRMDGIAEMLSKAVRAVK